MSRLLFPMQRYNRRRNNYHYSGVRRYNVGSGLFDFFGLQGKHMAARTGIVLGVLLDQADTTAQQMVYHYNNMEAVRLGCAPAPESINNPEFLLPHFREYVGLEKKLLSMGPSEYAEIGKCVVEQYAVQQTANLSQGAEGFWGNIGEAAKSLFSLDFAEAGKNIGEAFQGGEKAIDSIVNQPNPVEIGTQFYDTVVNNMNPVAFAGSVVSAVGLMLLGLQVVYTSIPILSFTYYKLKRY
jgi:hypothetical protein